MHTSPAFSVRHSRSLAGLAVALTVLTGCQEKKAPPPPPPPTVIVAPVQHRDVPIYAEWLGTLDGFINAQIRPQVTGYLLRQNYTEGSRVKKGDLLFEIDPRTFQATYDQVKANFDKSQTDLQRAQKLVKENVVSQEEFDNASAANLSAKAALETAQLNLDFTKITSPIDGVAGIAEAQIGNLVGQNSELTVVSQIDPIKVYFNISEQAYLAFRADHANEANFEENLKLQLILSNGSVYPLEGKFFATDREVEVRTGTLRLAGVFPNPDLLLRPGQYARIRAVVRIAKDAILVPQRSVSELQSGYMVVVVDAENKAHLRPVKVGDRVGTDWIIESGLQPTDRVIVEGMQRVRDGVTVNVSENASPVTAAKSS